MQKVKLDILLRKTKQQIGLRSRVVNRYLNGRANIRNECKIDTQMFEARLRKSFYRVERV